MAVYIYTVKDRETGEVLCRGGISRNAATSLGVTPSMYGCFPKKTYSPHPGASTASSKWSVRGTRMWRMPTVEGGVKMWYAQTAAY